MEDDNFYKQIIQIEEYQKIKKAIKEEEKKKAK